MPKDLILHRGAIHTMDPRMPVVEALAIRDSRILAVGPSVDILSLGSPETLLIDLAGRTVVPGFNDAHLHFCSHGLVLQQVDLADASSLDEALDCIRTAAAGTKAGEWLRGRGWNHNIWPIPIQPTRHDLDRILPNTPAAFSSKDGHSLWANSAALAIAGIDTSIPAPSGGQILREPSGEPSGILTETAQSLIRDYMPKVSPQATRDAARAAVADAARLGLTSVHNCEGPDSFAAFQHLAAAGELMVRIWHMIPLAFLPSALKLGLHTGFGNNLLRIGHCKMFADGALGSATAEMLAPYEGHPDMYGVAATDSSTLYEAVSSAARGGLASAIHAIGDAANRRVLDIYERVAREGLAGDLRQRIEHVQLLTSQDLPRLAQLGVIASMQPVHCTQDMDMADLHWRNRARWSYAWQSLLASGATLAFGTDCPVEALDPIAGLYAAVTRQQPNGRPKGGWYPKERLSLDQALYAYTMGSAIASSEEHLKGSLTPGKLADLVILSRDIYAEPPEALLQTVVDTTILGGAIVYERY
jgi:hypothetical protein